MNVLISIKQEYVDKILAGIKKWEFRKRSPRGRYNRYFMYECGKDGKRAIVGVFLSYERTRVTEHDVHYLLSSGGVSKEDLLSYMPCMAIRIEAAWRLNTPVTLEDIGLDQPPQSWQYLNDDQVSAITRKSGDVL